jgi:hypothetical protein
LRGWFAIFRGILAPVAFEGASIGADVGDTSELMARAARRSRSCPARCLCGRLRYGCEPDIVKAQIQGAIIFGITAALDAGKIRCVIDPDNPYPKAYTGHIWYTQANFSILKP